MCLHTRIDLRLDSRRFADRCQLESRSTDRKNFSYLHLRIAHFSTCNALTAVSAVAVVVFYNDISSSLHHLASSYFYPIICYIFYCSAVYFTAVLCILLVVLCILQTFLRNPAHTLCNFGDIALYEKYLLRNHSSNFDIFNSYNN